MMGEQQTTPAEEAVNKMVDLHGIMQEELAALGMDPAIADRLAQPLFLRLRDGDLRLIRFVQTESPPFDFSDLEAFDAG